MFASPVFWVPFLDAPTHTGSEQTRFKLPSGVLSLAGFPGPNDCFGRPFVTLAYSVTYAPNDTRKHFYLLAPAMKTRILEIANCDDVTAIEWRLFPTFEEQGVVGRDSDGLIMGATIRARLSVHSNNADGERFETHETFDQRERR